VKYGGRCPVCVTLLLASQNTSACVLFQYTGDFYGSMQYLSWLRLSTSHAHLPAFTMDEWVRDKLRHIWSVLCTLSIRKRASSER
jgi:hypothetical protein